MRKICFLLIIVGMICIFSENAAAQLVQVEGVGASRPAAMREAAKLAVEQVTGALVSGKTEVQRGAVVNDTVYLKSLGFVRGLKVLRQWQEGGMTHVQVQVDVETSPNGELLNRLQMSIILGDVLPAVGVLPLQAKGLRSADLRQEELSMVTDFVYGELAASDRFSLVERSVLDMADSERLTAAQWSQLGGQAGAQYLLVGSIGGVTSRQQRSSAGDRSRITATVALRLVEVMSGQVALAGIGHGRGDSALAAVESAVHDGFYGKKGIFVRLAERNKGGSAP